MDRSHEFIYINNIKVIFPFKPYETQNDYMQKVIETIQTRQNAVLESPTGTGKTLSLLCATLAWMQSQSNNQKMIYYTSRTHLQLSQAAKEMKRTAYARVPSVVIGSRAQMCLNEEVRQQPDHLINRSCRNAIAKNGCSYYSNYEQKLETMDQQAVQDIEDLHDFGRRHQCCPYYASKKTAESKASLVFMPYNYLLDLSLKKSLQLKLENSIIIFDEAHNIESALSEAASGSFRMSCLKTLQESCMKLPEKLSDAINRDKHGLTRTGYDPQEKRTSVVNESSKSKDPKQKDKEPKVSLIEELSAKLTNERIQQVNDCCGKLVSKIKFFMKYDETCSIEKVYSLFEECSIHYASSNNIIETLDSMISFWSVTGVMNVHQVAKYVGAISSLNHVISLLYPDGCLSVTSQSNHKAKLVTSYKAHLAGIYNKSNVLEKGTLTDWDLNVWCLHPSIGLERIINASCINGPRSIIITSGTLSPRNQIIEALEIPRMLKFRVSAGFKHVIGPNQLKILMVGESAKRFQLKADFVNVQNPLYRKELGHTLLSFLRLLPYGTLVFFPSYSLMNSTIDEWKKTTIWNEMSKTSSLFIESKQKETFESNLMAFKRKTTSINSSDRAVFFGVCRGKLSEGINLEGNQCRTVLIVGLPFPNNKDPRVLAMMDFNKSKNNNYWYPQQMLRALNQTIGRVIRSKDDFGMLLLCDPRFSQYRFSVSEWTQEFYPLTMTPVEDVENQIYEFFGSNNIDIVQSISSDSSSVTGPGAFEFDSEIARPSIRPFSSTQAFNQREVINGKQVNSFDSQLSTSQLKSPPLDANQRLLQLKKAYTVDQATYDRVRRAKDQPSDGSQQSDSSNQSLQPNGFKRPKTTADAFDSIFSDHSQLTSVKTPTSLETQGTDHFSILDLPQNRPTKYICYICSNVADRPHATNCKCAKVGCDSCLRVLNNVRCGKCDTVNQKKKFKPRLFHSAFSSKERQPVSKQ